jgi:hypothetical protein
VIVVVSSSFVVGHVVVGVGIVDGWVDIVEAVVDIVGLAAVAEAETAAVVVGIHHDAAVEAQQMLDIEPPEQEQQQVLPPPLMLVVAVAVAVQLDDIGLEMAVVVKLDDS